MKQANTVPTRTNTLRTPLLTFLLTVRVPRCFSHPCLIELRLLRWWTAVSAPAQIINTYQPAGEIEEFFQLLAKFKDLPTRKQAINKTYTDEQINEMKRLFEAHGMVLTGLPLIP